MEEMIKNKKLKVLVAEEEYSVEISDEAQNQMGREYYNIYYDSPNRHGWIATEVIPTQCAALSGVLEEVLALVIEYGNALDSFYAGIKTTNEGWLKNPFPEKKPLPSKNNNNRTNLIISLAKQIEESFDYFRFCGDYPLNLFNYEFCPSIPICPYDYENCIKQLSMEERGKLLTQLCKDLNRGKGEWPDLSGSEDLYSAVSIIEHHSIGSLY